jgi:hypothetical protein
MHLFDPPVMGTARWKGGAGNRGRPLWIGGRGFNTTLGGGSGRSRTGRLYRRAFGEDAGAARDCGAANKLARIVFAMMKTGESFRTEMFAKA